MKRLNVYKIITNEIEYWNREYLIEAVDIKDAKRKFKAGKITSVAELQNRRKLTFKEITDEGSLGD